MNPVKGEAVLQAGDTSYTLALDINALCEAEDALGMDIDLLLTKYASGTSVKLVRGLVWAGLQAHHPCTMQEAGAIVSTAGFLAAKTALEKALTLAMPVPDEDASPKKAKTRGAGTG